MTKSISRAADFLSSLGVVASIPYTDGGYANIANVAADLNYLGISEIRTGITNGQNGSAPLSSYITLAQKGVKFTICLFAGGTLTTANLQSQLALVAQLNSAVPGSVVAVEGPNEINNAPLTYNGVGGLQGAINLQQDIYSEVQANPALKGVAVDYFTGYSAGTISVGPDPATTPGLANFDNQHPYPQNGQPPYQWVSPALALPNETAPIGPTVYTETGYSTDWVSADVQAKYSLDLVMDDAQYGISKTFLYQLMDAYPAGSPQGDDGYGLFDPSNQSKEAATALHDLTTILADTGATAVSFTPAAMAYSIANLPTTGHSLDIQKSSGVTDIVVWNEPAIWNAMTNTEVQAATTNVTVSLGGVYQTVKVFDPLLGTTAVQTLTNVGSVTLGLTDHPLIVEVEPQQTPTPVPPAGTPPTNGSSSDTLVLNMSEIPVSGKDAEFTVSLDGTQIGGIQTITALETAGASQNITLTGSFGIGTHTVSIDYLDGFTGSAADAGRALYLNAIMYDNATTFPDARFLFDSTTNYTAVTPAKPVVSNAGTADTLVLNLSETAVSGQDAHFMVAVDGQLVGGVRTVTASHAAGQSQNLTLTGNFGSGSHTIAIDLVNGFSGTASDIGRTLYVNSITLDGATTSENAAQTYGAQYYKVIAGTSSKPPTMPIVTLAAAPQASNTSPATLGTAMPGTSGDALTVSLLSDTDFSSGSTVTLSNGTLSYKPGMITASKAGSDAISYVVTDTVTGAATKETQTVKLIAPTVATPAPVVTLAATPQASGTAPATLGAATPGTAGDALTVSLLSDTDFSSGSTVTLSNGTLSYKPGVITASNAGSDTIAYVVTDAVTGATTKETQTVKLITPAAPVVTLAATPQASNTSPATLGTVTPGTASDALTVGLLSDADFSNGSSITLTNGALIYKPGVITASNAGSDTISYVVTDTVTGATTKETQNVKLTAPTVSTPAANLTGGANSIFGENGVVLYNWNPSTQLSHWIAAESKVATGVPGAQAKIVAFGDSMTSGVSAPEGQSYPDDLTHYLALNSGLPAQNDNAQGDQADFNQLSFINGGTYNWGILGAGASMVQLAAPGQGVVWTPLATGTYDRLNLNYWDNASGVVTVTATGGPNGTVSKELQLGNSGQMMTQTIDLPAGAYTKVTVTADTSAPAFIEGMNFWSSTQPSIQIFNAGAGGAWSSVVGNGQNTGTGEFPGGLELGPSLAIIDYGSNDINNNTYTAAQTTANLALMVTECRSVNCDPILMIHEPFNLNPQLPNTISNIAQLTTDVEALSVQDNVPIIDLNATYASSPSTYTSSNLIGEGNHPGVSGYTDIAERIASLLTGTPQTYANSASYVVQAPATVTGTSGNDVLFSTSVSNTLIGNGGSDTYIMGANDQSDTVINGTSASGGPTGQLYTAVGHNQLWFVHSGNNLVVDVLGTTKQVTIQNWYGSSPAQLQDIVGGDGLQIDTGLPALVQAMASFAAANPSFNPTTTQNTSVAGTSFGAVATAAASAWHTYTAHS